jgi:hypothetical protein
MFYKVILLISVLFFIGFNESLPQPVINLSVNNYNYNQKRINSLCGYKFTVTNTGNTVLNITSMNFSSLRFRVDTILLPYPVVIQPSASRQIRVWFNPVSATTINDSLAIVSNASNLPLAKIYFSGTGVNLLSTLGYIFWQGLVPDNLFTSYDDYQPISIKQISDANGDGVNEVIVSSGNYLTTCYNGNACDSADILWVFNTGYNNNNTGAVTWEDGMQIREDIDGDGVQDVVIGCAGGNEEVYTISGRTGRQIWVYGDSVTYSDGDIEAVRVDKDYNGDGIKDVLVSASGSGSGTGGRHSLICLDGTNGNVIFYTVQTADFTGDVLTTDFGGAIGIAYGSGYSVKGFDNFGTSSWSYAATGKIWTMKEFPTIGTDTVKEIIGNYGFSGGLFCIAENNGSVNWTKTLGSSNNGRIQLLDDLDSNGYIDFTLYGPQSAYRIDSKTSNILWINNLASSYLRGAGFLSDVNGDGKRDILISTQQPGKVLVLDGTNGNILFTYQWGTSISQRGDRCAVLQSIDGNSTTEFIGGCRDGRIFCFSGGQNIPTGITPISNNTPEKFELLQNYPNPFNPETKIKFVIAQNLNAGGITTLKIYDDLGKEIKTLVEGNLMPGNYEVTFNGIDLPSGVYFYKLQSNNFLECKKMILIK